MFLFGFLLLLAFLLDGIGVNSKILKSKWSSIIKMSEAKIDPSIIKKTQDTLGRIIQAPSLTEKLLNRPPVQFLQDITKSVIKTTGFMKGLYSAEELEGAYIKASKENKILFLTKLVTAVGIATGDHLSVKPTKIAAGVESEKTNELLQALARAINKKPDNEDLVKKTLKQLKTADDSEDKPEKEERSKEKSREKKDDDEKPKKSESRDKERDREKDKERDKDKERHRDKEERDKDKDRHKDREEKDRHRDRDKDEKSRHRDEKDKEKDRHRDKDREDRDDKDREHRDKSKSKHEESSRSKDRHGDREKDKDREKDRHRDKEKEREKDESGKSRSHKDKDSEESRSKSKGRRGSKNEDEISKDSKVRSKKVEDNEEDDYGLKKGGHVNNDDDGLDNENSRKRPSSARGPRVHIEREENSTGKSQIDNDDRNMARPTTARPGAPRPRVSNESEDQMKPVSSKKKTQIVNGESDDDDDFVVKENKFQDDEKKNFSLENEHKKRNQDGEEEDENHGALVKKILESKEQLEYGSELNRTKGDPQKNVGQMDMQRKKEKERVQKEIDKLKESIQTLTKASIPLGRTLDFLQEDIDMMQKEIIKWSDEYESNLKALKRQKTETQSFIEPYKAALNDIESQVTEQSEKIANVKRKIILNEEKINKLIFNVGKNI